MTAARTTWRAKPCGWRDRERVVALGEEFGPAGPLVLDVLEELAKEQRSEGHVRTGLRSLSRAAFLPRGTTGIDQARAVLAFAATVGALDELDIDGDVEMTVTCRVSGFEKDQGTGYESVRKSQQRAAGGDVVPPKTAQQDDVPNRPENRDNTTACPEPGDTVPVCPPTGQDRRGQKEEEEAARAAAPEPSPILDELRDLLTADSLRLAWDDMAVQHGLDAHPWASDRDLRAAASAVASWAAQTTDGPRVRHAARLLRSELDQMDRRRTKPGPRSPGAPPLRAVGGSARATAPDRAAEFRRLAAEERAKEASA